MPGRVGPMADVRRVMPGRSRAQDRPLLAEGWVVRVDLEAPPEFARCVLAGEPLGQAAHLRRVIDIPEHTVVRAFGGAAKPLLLTANNSQTAHVGGSTG